MRYECSCTYNVQGDAAPMIPLPYIYKYVI